MPCLSGSSTIAKTPFIILADRRTGSNWLESLLNSHPRVMCFAEIHAGKEHRQRYVRQFRKTFHFRPITLRPSVQTRFLYFWSFRHYDTVGFRLFPRHLELGQNRRLLPTLQRLKGLRVLSLRRENVLRSYVSLRIALNTNVWRAQDVPNYWDMERTVRVEVPDFLAYARAAAAAAETLEGHFQHCPHLSLTYEQLCRDTQTECRRIQAFLGLEPQTLCCQMKPMNPDPLTQLIQNYDEVRARLVDSPMRWMLEESS